MSIGARVRHLIAGADVWGVERIGERVEGKTEVVVDGVSAVERAARKEWICVFNRQLAGLVVVVRLEPSLEPDRISRTTPANRRRPSSAVLIGAVVTVESVQQAILAREPRFVGDDVDRASERIGAIQQRAGTIDDLHAADRV